MIEHGLIALTLLSLGVMLAWFTAGILILKKTGLILSEHRMILRVLLIIRWPILVKKINDRIQGGGR